MTTKKPKAKIMAEEKWHALPEEDVFYELQSSRKGLSSEEASKRLGQYGINVLPIKEPPTIWEILLHQILNPLIFILIAAAGASLAIGEMADAIFIFIVIVLNSGMGAYQEYSAEKSAHGLQVMLKINALVLRDGQKTEISAEELVPGDIVFLDPGKKVPADIRLLEVSGLEADESFLTGESIAAEKTSDLLKQDVSISERMNIAFAGATITSGRAMGIVISTGMNTEVGKIAENVTLSESAKPPLVMRMESFTKQISIIVVFFSFILGFILWLQNTAPAEIFFFVVALAVSAIPEGLPVALTVALSIATSRMSKRNVIVRKLTAVESLGSCTIIASDKTGTLTVNQQTIKLIEFPNGKRYEITGEGYNGKGEVILSEPGNPDKNDKVHLKKISKLGILTNEGNLKKEDDRWVHHGDAMDVAFLALGYKLKQDPESIRKEFSLVDEIPYESEKKFSAAFYKENGQVHVAAKGAVETILGFCDQSMVNGSLEILDPKIIEQHTLSMAEQGYRVLAVAGGHYNDAEIIKKDENIVLPPLHFYGLVGFIDPLRPEVIDAVEKCHQAGIKVLMITGDHPATAASISKELGILEEKENVVTGHELERIGPVDSPAYGKLVSSTHVFARVSPTQKFEIVDALIQQGEFVAVTGDGVNDAPALRKANIGVAMGSGTDVAKEISSMIVTDDNFSSIVAGVEEGRFAYDNVRKVIYLLISTGTAEVILFIASIIAGLPMPLLAVQLLWLNLVTNGIQDVALAFEGGEPGAMQRKPRTTTERIFNPLMIQQTLISGFTMGLIAFGFWFFLKNFQVMEETHARNMVLLLMVFMQNVHVFNCRSEKVSAFKVPINQNIILVFGVLVAQGIHILSMHIPFMQNVLRVEPITFIEWAEVLVPAIPLLLVMEIFKKIRWKIKHKKAESY
jgi:magnesium-transporting ATPase (P-type)